MIKSSRDAWSPAPISALRAFDAASRCLSFTAAAVEIGVTQSAISHSIRDLESRLSTPLFRRRGPQLELTEAGRRYAPFVKEALNKLRAGDIAVTNPNRRAKVLTVSVSPSFASKWLAPRIGAFAVLHPDLDLRVSATAEHVDFADDDIDLAVRHGNGDWPSLSVTRMCAEFWIPVCRPDVVECGAHARDLLQTPLIHHRDGKAWRKWFEDIGIIGDAANSCGLTFNEMSLAIDAAVAGQGVALARSALAARDLIAGRLHCPIPDRQPVEYGYWIVRPKDRPGGKKVNRFVAWLCSEAAAEEEALDRLLSGANSQRPVG